MGSKNPFDDDLEENDSNMEIFCDHPEAKISQSEEFIVQAEINCNNNDEKIAIQNSNTSEPKKEEIQNKIIPVVFTSRIQCSKNGKIMQSLITI